MSGMNSKSKSEQFNSIDKTLSVIDYIFGHESTFIEIQKELNLPKATLHRILQSLEDHEYIEKDAITNKYYLGLKFIYYGEGLKARLSLTDIAKESLVALAETIGESISLCILHEGMSLSLLFYRGEESALTSHLVPFSPLNCCASGKLFLSNMSDSDVEAYFNSNAPLRKTARTIMTLEDFLEEKEKIINENVSYDDEEYEYGLFCMSVPLYSYNGRIDASIGITAPKGRLFLKDKNLIKNMLVKTADEISERLVKMKYDFEF